MAPTIEDLSALKNENIRKALRGFIAVAPMSVTPPTAITQSAQSTLRPLIAGWARMGNITKKSGLSFKRQTDNSEVESWGQAESSRIDIVKDMTSVTFECQETRKPVLQEYYQVDLSAITPDATSKEVNFAQPTVLRKIYRRMLFIAADGYGEDEIYIGKLLPRFTVTQVGDQAWSEDDPLNYGITGNAMVDSRLGFSVKHFFGGPGWAKSLRDAGFNSTYTLTVSGVTGNTYKLSVNGEETSALAFDATNAAIEAALNALVSVGPTGADVQGTGPFTVTLVNDGDLKVVPGATANAVLV